MLPIRRLALCAALTSYSGGLVCARAVPSRSLASVLNLRGGQLQGALFDFDGTLAQSEEVHRLTFSELLGYELTPDYWNAKCVGNSPRSILEKHIAPERLAAGETVDGLLQRRCHSSRTLLPCHRRAPCGPIHGAPERHTPSHTATDLRGSPNPGRRTFQHSKLKPAHRRK
jgi:hypothetical protein